MLSPARIQHLPQESDWTAIQPPGDTTGNDEQSLTVQDAKLSLCMLPGTEDIEVGEWPKHDQRPAVDIFEGNGPKVPGIGADGLIYGMFRRLSGAQRPDL